MAAAFCLETGEAAAQDGWNSHLLLEGLAGDEIAGDFRAWLPLWQDPAKVLFFYPYYSIDNNGGQAAGAGLGYRARLSDDWLAGVYGFVDATKAYGEWFGQASLGLEALSSIWEARLNGYIPLGGEQRTPEADSPFAVLNQLNMLEVPIAAYGFGMYGADGEVGARLIDFPAHGRNGEIRAFAGAYSWWHDQAETITGVSGRIEARLNDFAGLDGTRLTFGGVVTHDNVDGTRAAALASLRVPLGRRQRDVSRGGYAARMDEDITRRWGGMIAIRHDMAPAYFITDPDDAPRATGKVYFVDEDQDAGNDGLSPESATALSKTTTHFAENDIIVALDQVDDKDIETGGAALRDGQALIAGGSMLPVTSMAGGAFYYAAPGAAGTIAQADHAGYALTLANDNIVLGLGITSIYEAEGPVSGVAMGGIYGAPGTSGAWIVDNTIGVALTNAAAPQPEKMVGENGDGEATDGESATGTAGSDGVADSSLTGISLAASVGAHLAGNTIDVAVNGSGSQGGDATGGHGTTFSGSAGKGGNATGGAGGIGVTHTTVVGIDLSGAQSAFATWNTIDLLIEGQGGAGGVAEAGNGAGGNVPAGTGGEGRGGAGGIGVLKSSVSGLVLSEATGSDIDGTVVNAAIEGHGGAGAKGSGGNAGAASEGGLAGAGHGGPGGTGIDTSEALGVQMHGGSGVTISDSTVHAALDGYGGMGGDGSGGRGGNGATAGSGGLGSGGAGGLGVFESNVAGASVREGAVALSEVDFLNNVIGATIDGDGGEGGVGRGGLGGTGDAGPNSGVKGGTGGAGSGGGGGGGLRQIAAVGIDLQTVSGVDLGGNTIDAAIGGTGGNGSNGQGGDGGDGIGPESTGGDGGNGSSGGGGTGISAFQAFGVRALLAEGTNIFDNEITVSRVGIGGNTANGIGGNGGDSSDLDAGHGGAGGDGGGSSGGAGVTGVGDGVFHGILTSGSNMIIDNNQIVMARASAAGQNGSGVPGAGGNPNGLPGSISSGNSSSAAGTEFAVRIIGNATNVSGTGNTVTGMDPCLADGTTIAVSIEVNGILCGTPPP